MPELFHRKIERSAIGFVVAIIAAASVGGIVEIAPLFTIDETVEQAPDMRVYTPLELAGRNIYVREGCYACHSLADAGTTGTVGPNFDEVKPSFELVATRVTEGKGAMPTFASQLEPQEIADVAQYVAEASAG